MFFNFSIFLSLRRSSFPKHVLISGQAMLTLPKQDRLLLRVYWTICLNLFVLFWNMDHALYCVFYRCLSIPTFCHNPIRFVIYSIFKIIYASGSQYSENCFSSLHRKDQSVYRNFHGGTVIRCDMGFNE